MEDTNVKKTILWSSSHGIASNQQLPLFFPGQSISRIHQWLKPIFKSPCPLGDGVIGWGNKPNTRNAKKFSEQFSLPYIRLEDGFIGYLGHPSSDNNRLSLIKDDVGIYYDGRVPSRLEQLCLASAGAHFSAADSARAESLVQKITIHGLSKYNHVRGALPAWLVSLLAGDVSCECVLLVDQTAGDQSITSGLASADSFQLMLNAALSEHPGKQIIIKTHPDVVIAGARGKRGHFHDVALPNNVHLLTEDCAISELMQIVSDVYVVTSQLGFEALLYGKRVRCFGLPFYAGWGLTQDEVVCERRNVSLSLPQLVTAALVDYPTYLNPETHALCEVEEVVDWLILQQEPAAVSVCYAFGFSLWKRAFVKQFVGRMAKQVVFVNDVKTLESLLAKAKASPLTLPCAVLLWGRGRACWANTLRTQADVWFMEDGFLRSVGLGADLRRPSCLVIDRQGMYYDSSENSDVIDILNSMNLTAQQQLRAKTLTADIKRFAVTKYNVGKPQDHEALLARLSVDAKPGCEIVVVPGQFEDDLSIACSLGEIKTNIGLLAQVRQDYPEALIVFKEHPDVYSGVRPGALGERAAMQFADVYLADVDMDSLLACADRVCTLTSLTGFEALLRGKAVTVYGSPFYAGWGLTTDIVSLPGRHKTLTLEALVYGAMIEYSRYVDWNTGYLTGPEQTVAFLASQRECSDSEGLKSDWLARQWRKCQYFIDAYFF